MKFLVLFKLGNAVKAASLDSLPEAFFWENQRFERLNGHLGDFNHLLDADGNRVGYEFPFAETFGISWQENPMLKANNVWLDWDALRISLTGETRENLRSDGCMGIGNDVFESEQKERILVLPSLEEWSDLRAKGKLAIPVEQKEFPTPIISKA